MVSFVEIGKVSMCVLVAIKIVFLYREKVELPRAFVSLSPTENEFKYGIRGVISGFENTVGEY